MLLPKQSYGFAMRTCLVCRIDFRVSLNREIIEPVDRVIPSAINSPEKSSVLTVGVLLPRMLHPVQWLVGKVMRKTGVLLGITGSRRRVQDDTNQSAW